MAPAAHRPADAPPGPSAVSPPASPAVAPSTPSDVSPPDPPADDLLLRATLRHSRGRSVLLLLCGAGAAAAAVALPAVLGRTLDLLLAGRAGGTQLLLCAALLVTETALDAAVALLGGLTGARSTAWLRGRATTALLAGEPRRAAAFPAGDLATRLTANAADAGTAPVTAATATAALLPPLGGLAGLLLLDAWTAAAFLAGLPLLVLLLRAFARASADGTLRYQQAQSRLAGRLTEVLSGARTVAAAGTGARERARVLAPLAEMSEQGHRVWRVHGRAAARAQILMPLLMVLVLAVGGIRLSAGELTVGELLAVSRYAALAAGIGALTGALGALIRARTAARRLTALTTLDALPHGSGELPAGGRGALELRGVTVVRDGTALLRDIDLALPGGTTTAVVGRSGAGKSLLAAVAGRLTDPDRGEVRLDGVPLATLDRSALRREVGYAFERPVLFGDTVAQALAFGPYTPPAEQVHGAATAAGADSFVRLLPRGYETPLTEAPLSGGERQRLGLARAFAHAGRLLILDDATSSLDTVTERQVGRALATQVGEGARLVVAHRLSSAARADQVVWLDEGRVRAVGPHAVLWQQAAYRGVFGESGEDEEGEGRTALASDLGAGAEGCTRAGAGVDADARRGTGAARGSHDAHRGDHHRHGDGDGDGDGDGADGGDGFRGTEAAHPGSSPGPGPSASPGTGPSPGPGDTEIVTSTETPDSTEAAHRADPPPASPAEPHAVTTPEARR
ncbi:ABC transporter ATP-binding protein [Streptomyces physcomitrii]|uniref:ABC transporter ATP-binding protein n=1 Tax=Streptomyces physcomitrii TaxID=2724184 RepID=UPI003F4CEE97